MKQRILSGSVLGGERTIAVKTLDLPVMIDPSDLTVGQRLDGGGWHDLAINQDNCGRFLTVKKTDSSYKQVVTLFSSDSITNLEQAMLIRTGLRLDSAGFEHVCAIRVQCADALRRLGWVVDLDHPCVVRGVYGVPCIWGIENALYLKWVPPVGVGTMFIGVNK